MNINRKAYVDFLETEYNTQMEEYGRLINTKATILKERGDVFVGLFEKIDIEQGMATFKIKVSDNMPRKNSFWTASLFEGEMGKFKNWGDLSWADLREKHQIDYSDAHCIWVGKSDSQDFCLIGIKNLSLEFAKKLEQVKPIVAFGPNDPPLKYLLNLISIAKDTSSSIANKILDFENDSNRWNPSIIKSDEDFTSLMLNMVSEKSYVVVQGPPGTGKTYRMAALTSKLLSMGKSVLVTALTNQALMELASKDDLKSALKDRKVSKSSLSVDEIKNIPQLTPIKDNACNAASGYLSLASFYIASNWAVINSGIPPFDYVIMDEASQAYFPMIAASVKLGNKVIWIGDQNQLSPIAITNEDIIEKYNWGAILRGFNTLCENFEYPSYMLSDTYRLTKRGAAFTGIFYSGNLNSVSNYNEIPDDFRFLPKSGGPIWETLSLPIGEKIPEAAIALIYNRVQALFAKNNKYKIAILSKFKDTVRELQKQFILRFNRSELPKNIIIETVDRVQGLTVDFCIYFIPNASIQYSLVNDLFNVATSRAKYSTIIISDDSVLKRYMSQEIRMFLLKAKEDNLIEFSDSPQSKVISSGTYQLKVLDTMDVYRFERKRTEIDPHKENVYIVDTNVFVNCPDIISKIGKEYKVLIPATVLEELDKLKLKKGIDVRNLNKAAQNIGAAFTKSYSKLEEPDTSLLPDGFDKNNPDCKILSVALKYKSKGQNAIVLTSDNILLTRASGLGLTTISLKEFTRKPK